MLVTTANVLKLTDFGEARAAELNVTMTAVGTPIYLCPEIIRNDRYGTKADVYSFAIVLVAMMRCEDNIVNFFFNALIIKMGKKTRAGVGLNALNINVAEGWRPMLPKEFYPSLIKLIWRCWDDNPDVRPDFDEIVGILMGDVVLEIRTNHEPIFGSGNVIEDVEQKGRDLVDAGGEMVPRMVMDEIIREKDRDMTVLVVERDRLVREMIEDKEKVMKELRLDFMNKLRVEKDAVRKEVEEVEEELRRTLQEREDELMVLRTTGRGGGGGEGEGGGGRKTEADADMMAMLAMSGRGGSEEKKKVGGEDEAMMALLASTGTAGRTGGQSNTDDEMASLLKATVKAGGVGRVANKGMAGACKPRQSNAEAANDMAALLGSMER